MTWLASLRVRLIITYVLVTAFSFGLLYLMIMNPVETFLRQREEDNLVAVAKTLGSTIRSPIECDDPAAFAQDLYWTYRRCRLFLRDTMPKTRFRILDSHGKTLTDSEYAGAWSEWMTKQRLAPSLKTHIEVRSAMLKSYGADTRFASSDTSRLDSYRMFVALPIVRQGQLAFIMYLDKPLDVVQVNLRYIRSIIRYGMFASALVTILVSILLSSHLSAGLQSAMQVARAFAAGRMDLRMRALGRDEVGQLGAAFNQMADALQRQEQLRRDLLADVSHELRTPLTAIAGCADTLADGALRDDPETAEHFLAIMHRESKRLQRLVADILELSKLRAGAIAIPLAPVAICPLIEEGIEIAHMRTAHRDVAITVEYPAECAGETLHVLGHEDRLAQALRNLLDNAQHHTPAGRRVSVAVEVQADAVVIHVRDEGDGIPAEDLPFVFDRFYRAGKGETTSGGTGLGLAIVREIMHAHRGEVTVQSVTGTGTTFSLHLQRVQAE
jgi:signal transduction histidine kinase